MAMAFLLVAKQSSLTLILISLFLSSSHGRESQHFSKVGRPTATNVKGAAVYSNQQVENTEEQADGKYPSFYKQDDDNPHGLYVAPSPPTFPEYYNPVAYVTPVAEELPVNHIPTLPGEETHSYTAPTTRNDEYEKVGAMFVEKQGMSDTRYLENGKFFYDVDKQEFNNNHPFEVLKANNRNAQFHSYEARPNAFTGYVPYNSKKNYNSMEMNDQNEEGQLYKPEDYSDMP